MENTHSLSHLLSHMFCHGLILVYQGWYALIVLGNAFNKSWIIQTGGGGWWGYKDLNANFCHAEPQQQQSVNFVKVSIIISNSSLSTLLTPDPLSICSDFPIFLGKMCNFFSSLFYHIYSYIEWFFPILPNCCPSYITRSTCC